MAEVLVLVEHAEGALKKVTSELITAARALGEPAGSTAAAASTGHDTPAEDAHEPVAKDDAQDVQDRKDGAAGKPSLPPTHTES